MSAEEFPFPDPIEEMNQKIREALRDMTPEERERVFAGNSEAPSVSAIVAASQEEGASWLYPGKILQRAVEITHPKDDS